MSVLGKNDNKKYTLLKAEALCAELLDNGFPFDKLLLKPVGSFRKSYRNDFVISDQKDIDADELEILINRDGIYDRLPEGLFHQTRGNSKTSSISDMVEEHRRFKEEEKNARRFFQPIEQEFYRFAIMVEQEERKLEKGLYEGSLEKLFYDFWDVSPELPSEAASRLMRIMPWTQHIKGDLEATSKALSLLLGKHVTGIEKQVMIFFENSDAMALGTICLGVDSVTGKGYEDFSIQWIFSVKEINETEISKFISDEKHERLIKRFEEIFIPLTVDAVFEYEISTNYSDEEKEEWHLGYSLAI